MELSTAPLAPALATAALAARPASSSANSCESRTGLAKQRARDSSRWLRARPEPPPPRRKTTEGEARPHMRPTGWGSGVTMWMRGLLRLPLRPRWLPPLRFWFWFALAEPSPAELAGDDGRLAGWSDGRRKMPFRRSSMVSLGADRCRRLRRRRPGLREEVDSSLLSCGEELRACAWASRRASASASTSSCWAVVVAEISSSRRWFSSSSSFSSGLRPLRFLGVADRLRRRAWSWPLLRL
mmetsp:Transcript_13488/g.31999  ORF Transcript_13488/g.31999 Transcript_13488/m.31999 type:complete len:240 (+) Transcript_13488:723-1442(+)